MPGVDLHVFGRLRAVPATRCSVFRPSAGRMITGVAAVRRRHFRVPLFPTGHFRIRLARLALRLTSHYNRRVLSAVVSALHVLAVAIGLPSVFLRARALRGTLDASGRRRLFAADNLWGVAAILFVTTGLLRAFAGLEKGTAFYLASHLFWTKMTLFVAIVLLEIWPMTTFIRWRMQERRGQSPDTSRARALYIVNHVQMALAVVMVFVAAFMARGFGAPR